MITKFYSTSIWVALSEGLQASTTMCIPRLVWEKMTHSWQVHFGCMSKHYLQKQKMFPYLSQLFLITPSNPVPYLASYWAGLPLECMPQFFGSIAQTLAVVLALNCPLGKPLTSLAQPAHDFRAVVLIWRRIIVYLFLYRKCWQERGIQFGLNHLERIRIQGSVLVKY